MPTRHYSIHTFCTPMTLTYDLETFSEIPTHLLNICGKFSGNLSTK